ncbi:MAG: hypothetical protein K5756_05020 [Clostridiales bacterium]|nr:hypothetical protein [Clostridiales bacterium]
MSIFGDLFDFNGDGKTDALEEFFGLSMMNAFVLGEDADEDDWDESDYYEDEDFDCD